MAEQLPLGLRVAERHQIAASASAINWRRVDRRARRILAAIAQQSPAEALRAGFALRQYAGQTAVFEALRAQLAASGIKRAARGSGRMPVKAAVLFAASRRGRRLHALVDREAKGLAAVEAIALCG